MIHIPNAEKPQYALFQYQARVAATTSNAISNAKDDRDQVIEKLQKELENLRFMKESDFQ